MGKAYPRDYKAEFSEIGRVLFFFFQSLATTKKRVQIQRPMQPAVSWFLSQRCVATGSRNGISGEDKERLQHPRGTNPESPLNPMVAQNHTNVAVLFLGVHTLGLFSFCWRTDPFILFFFSFLFCIVVQLMDNVVVVSGEQRRDSAIHIHVSFSPKVPSHPGCHITLSRVPYAIE